MWPCTFYSVSISLKSKEPDQFPEYGLAPLEPMKKQNYNRSSNIKFTIKQLIQNVGRNNIKRFCNRIFILKVPFKYSNVLSECIHLVLNGI